MDEPQIPLRELRPWLWLPVAALVFAVGLALTGLLRGFGVEAAQLVPTALTAVLAAAVVGGAATFWRGRGLRSWGAVGAFMLLTVAAHFVVGWLTVARGVVESGVDAVSGDGLVFTGVYFPVVMLFAFGWVALPVGGAAGLLAWTLARRARDARRAHSVHGSATPG